MLRSILRHVPIAAWEFLTSFKNHPETTVANELITFLVSFCYR